MSFIKEGSNFDATECNNEGKMKNQNPFPGEAIELDFEENDVDILAEKDSRESQGGSFVRTQKPPTRLEIESQIGKFRSMEENCYPSFDCRSPQDIDGWSKTPSFSNVWESLRSKTKDSFPNVHSNGIGNRFIWSPCTQPPKRGAIKTWIDENLNFVFSKPSKSYFARLSTIDDDKDAIQRAHSPDYDERTSFFFTSQSLDAFSTKRSEKNRSFHETSVFREGNPRS